MKIAFPPNSWAGGFLHSIMKAFEYLGHETFMVSTFNASLTNKIQRRIPINSISEKASISQDYHYNKYILQQIKGFDPDIFFNISGSGLFPETIKEIKSKKCLTICLIADNPCDPAPHRDKIFPMTLRYYDYLLNPEKTWNKLLLNLTPNSKIIKFYGGFDPGNFFPVDNITEEDRIKFNCDVSFTGHSYKNSPEGAYRSGIVGLLNDFSVKIWGDKDWAYRFQYYKSLKNAYQGERLNYNELRKLYTISTINLNLPSPQILSSFQPRVFEISATKGFQIIDHSDDLYQFFNRDEIVTFKSIGELKEKINYYLQNKEEREKIKDAMYNRVKQEFTWDNQIRILLTKI